MRRKNKSQPNVYAPIEDQYPYLSENERFLIGWPGYRTRPDKSGLAYADSYAEWGRVMGLAIRWLITGRFKTRNPVYLFFIAMIGLLYTAPLLVILFTASQGFHIRFVIFIMYSPCIILGVLLLVNFVLSLTHCKDGESITGD
jgi:hypothetical protein